MQKKSVAKLAKDFANLRRMTNVDMDLRPKILDFCKSQPAIARLALIDLLTEFIYSAEDIDDASIFSLLQTNLPWAPDIKTKKMLDRLFTTMVNKTGISTLSPPMPYCKMALNASVDKPFPRGSSDAPNELLCWTGVKCDPDDNDGCPMPKMELPAGITDSEEIKEFWNPSGPDSPHWESQWIEGNNIVADDVYVCACCVYQ
jgi:hypothetical protein